MAPGQKPQAQAAAAAAAVAVVAAAVVAAAVVAAALDVVNAPSSPIPHPRNVFLWSVYLGGVLSRTSVFCDASPLLTLCTTMILRV